MEGFNTGGTQRRGERGGESTLGGCTKKENEMTTEQMFFSIVGVIVVALGAQYAALKHYMDARFNSVDGRFTSVDNQLRFLTEHMVDHAERIAALEANNPQKR